VSSSGNQGAAQAIRVQLRPIREQLRSIGEQMRQSHGQFQPISEKFRSFQNPINSDTSDRIAETQVIFL
jgi:hypothetical protein